MHSDARTLDDGTTLEDDICIVGAGAAGISMALEWVDTSHDILLLEGGGFDVEAQMQALNDGKIVGQPYYPLPAARLRAFGGTTGHWGGLCAPFDPIDFESRDWVPHSGWPISREELDPFYARAQELPELGPYEYSADYWERQNPSWSTLPLDDDVVWTKMWQFSPPTRFGNEYRDEITGADSVHLYTYANAVELEVNEPVRAIDGVRIKTPNGKEHRAESTHYVLACGAVQNARLLLASNSQASQGLGNDHDLVGRYFMEHLEMPGAQLLLAEPRPMSLYTSGAVRRSPSGELSLRAEVQHELRVLNGTASLNTGTFEELEGTFQELPPEAVEKFRQMSEKEIEAWMEKSRREEPTRTEQRAFKLYSRQEQAPNPNSRVTLADETDALGMPRVVLDWQLTEFDRRSMRRFYEALGREIGRSGIGRVRLLEWLREDASSWPEFLSGGWHHMGTTRMSEDPTRGVVNSDCRVHGLGNLWVAGSAVFPTAGAANPTLTLIALTLRLSDHLKGKIG